MIENRIVGSGTEPLDGILFNPRNWRIHPAGQQAALEGVLDEVGYVQNVIINKRTGHLVDGHLRCQLAARKGEKEIPVVYIDISEEEEEIILAVLDPVAAMAVTDRQKPKELLDITKTENDSIKILLETIKGDKIDINPEWQGMPEFTQDDKSGITLTIHFENIENRKEFFKRINHEYTDRHYIWYPEDKFGKQDQCGTKEGLVFHNES